jgi:hypothetical protein
MILIIFFVGRYFDSKPLKEVEKSILETEDYQYVIDFETNKFLTNASSVSTEKFLSGSKSGKMIGYKAFSPGINIPVPTDDSTLIEGLNVKLWINPSSSNLNVTLVFSVLDQNKNQIHWDGYSIKKSDILVDNWHNFQHRFNFPAELISTNNTIRIYLWNQDDSNAAIYVDDVSIGFNENFLPERPRSKFIDFENDEFDKLSSKYSLSGFYSTFAKGKDGYSAAVKIPMRDIKYEELGSIAYSFHYLTEKPQVDASFVISITDSLNNDILWQCTHLKFDNHQTGVWDIGNGNTVVPEEALDSLNTIKIYLWNRNDNTIYIDDVYLVIKEKDASSMEKVPACNFINDKEFSKELNHPPYKIKKIHKFELSDNNISKLNRVFTKSDKALVSNFIPESDNSEILTFYKGKCLMIDFKESQIEVNDIVFEPKLGVNVNLLSDHGYVFVCNKVDRRLDHYKYSSETGKFVKIGEIENVDSDKTVDITINPDKTISIFENTGKVITYIQTNGVYNILSDKKLINPEFGNVKLLKGAFLRKETQVVLIYLQNSQDRYHIFDYNTSSHTWDLSLLHDNKSSQSFNKMKFSNDYYYCNYDKKNYQEILQLEKSPRFDLKMLNFNKMSYEILFNIDFVGFNGKQNPKYYEVNKVLCGNFTGDERTEFIIFQDNLHKVDWLTQKVEMYYFK